MFVVQDKSDFFQVKRGDETFSVPSVLSLPYQQIKEFRKLKDTDSAAIMDWVLDNVFDTFAPGLTDGMTFQQVAEMVSAYMTQTDGEELGES